jgi:hypothetical protein
MLEALGISFSESKAKPYLKMASQRIAIANNRKTNLIKASKREIAKLLQEGKEEKARIRVKQTLFNKDYICAIADTAHVRDAVSSHVLYGVHAAGGARDQRRLHDRSV